MNKYLILSTLILSLLLTPTVLAGDLEISGSIDSVLEVHPNEETITDKEEINLIFEKDYGFDASFYLDLEFNSTRISAEALPNGSIYKYPVNDRQTEITINRAYLDYYTNNIDWTLGKQDINWGSGFEVNPTSYFNPTDQTAFEPLKNKLGVSGISGIYYAPANMEITPVIVPFFKTNKTSDLATKSKLTTINQNVRDGLTEKVSAIIGTPTKVILDSNNPYKINSVADKIDNMQSGIKITKRSVSNYDYSLSAYQGRDMSPIVDMNATSNTIDPNTGDLAATINYVYPEVNKIGLNIIGEIKKTGTWVELSYSQYQDKQFDNRLEIVSGIDYKFNNNLYLIGQNYYKEGRSNLEQDINLTVFHAEKPVFNFHDFEGDIKYESETKTFIAELEFLYSLSNSTKLIFGGSYLTSDKDENSLIVSNLGGDKLYTKLQINF